MKKWIFGFLILALAVFGRTLYRAGTFKNIQPHFSGTVEKMYTQMPGTEDLELDRGKKILFISSADRWKKMKGEPTEDGIYRLSLDSEGDPVKIPHTFSGEFHPHGISYLKKDSANLLFVINHNASGNFVEIFEYRHDTLFHRQSITDPSMCCPNDLVAVDTDKFYVTNDHGSPKGLMRILEDYLLIPRSYLLYFNGKTFTRAYTGINYGNGVNVSANGEKLYLATTTGRTLLTFDRNISTGEIILAGELDLQSGIDNISVDADGNLWIASHPKLLAFVSHSKDSQKISPSQVFKLTPELSGGYTVQEIYLDDGKQISGSSIALFTNHELFIGVVFESKLLRLSIPN